MICPSRKAQGQMPGRDAWVSSRWTTDAEKCRRRAEEYMKEHPRSSMSPTWGLWTWTEWVPRTCTYCGGIHPEDAIRLVRDHGFEVSPTGKKYKRYIEPPGRRQAVVAAVQSGEGPVVRGAVPPIKLYVWHFDADSAARLNEAMRDGA